MLKETSLKWALKIHPKVISSRKGNNTSEQQMRKQRAQITFLHRWGYYHINR
jgi:hypothetical protein